jgi:hemolysin activation/secretion protein
LARCGGALAALLVACAAVQVAFAQAPGATPEATPRFEIRRFVFDGATLVSAERLEAATAAYTGPGRSFADVQRALEAVERLYGEAGFSAVQVLLPEQELERGDIRLQVIEAKLGRVIVEGNRHFDEDNILASVPSLAAGQAPNIRAIGRDLRVANENPAKQATVLLRSGREEATVDAVVRVADQEPSRFSVTLDNSGTEETGVLRLGLGYQHANVENRDNVLTLQYVGAPHEEGNPDRLSAVPSNRVLILGASLRVPLYASGDALEFLGGYSNVNSGTVGNLYNVSGAGGIFGARYLQNLDRTGEFDHRLAWAWDYRGYHNKDIKQIGSDQQLTPDITVHPVSLTYHGLWRRQGSETAYSIGALRNIPGGADGRPEDFCQLPPDAPHGVSRTDGMGNCPDPRYSAVRWSFNHSQALPRDWQARVAMNGQYTRDMLVSGEQFGLGGADSVRGFEERAIADDRGYRGTLEVYSPDLGGSTGWSGARLRLLAFYDWGGVRRVNPVPPDPESQHVSSAGLGLRFSRGANLVFRADYGWVLDAGGALGIDGSAGTFQARGDGRGHASFSYIF